jgi:asparagine synthase (glutamine-hydrolysing)
MCGIAGVLDLTGENPVPPGVIQAMAGALVHRGPDEQGFLEWPGLSLACRRLSIVGLTDGQQPVFNEDRSVAAVFNGELFDYPERKAALERRGHRFVTHCDTELIPHLWEDHGEGMFGHLRGQFAVALWDRRQRRLVLAGDRFGMCPLHWARVTRGGEDWLVFGSEVKALLASGLVDARPDPRGLDCIFNFFSVPAPVTCFAGVQGLIPGHSLRVEPGGRGRAARLDDRVYWQIDFPDEGQEARGQDPQRLADEFEAVLFDAVTRRLRADVPVVSYLSGGVDSSVVVAMAARALGRPLPTFTIRVQEPGFDETGPAGLVADHVGSRPVVVDFGPKEVVETYPRMVRAAEAPVVDVSTTGLLLLARAVHAHGYKVALTGEGSDEWLAGYPWFRIHRLLGALDSVPGLRLGQLARRGYLAVLGGHAEDWAHYRRPQEALGGPSAILELYALMGLARRRFYSPEFWERLGGYTPHEHLGPTPERFRRWHPPHRSMYWGVRIHLGGHLLSFKSDRIAMHSSVEVRYPFLDEEVFAFLAPLHPGWKLRGLREKYLLRLLAERWVARSIAWRRKQMFWLPYDAFSTGPVPDFADQLLSVSALRRTGYFDVAAVRRAWAALRETPRGLLLRVPSDMGLVAVLATQL